MLLTRLFLAIYIKSVTLIVLSIAKRETKAYLYSSRLIEGQYMAVFLKSFVALLRSILLSFLAIYVCPNILLSILRPRLARHNKIRRKAILRELGVTSDTKVLVGLFHPDW